MPLSALADRPVESIRHPVPEDAAELIALNRTSADHDAAWLSPPVDETQFARYLTRCGEESFRGFLICRTEDDAIVGVANLSQIFRGDFLNAYLGYYVGTPFAGRGYMRQGLSLVLDHAFGPLELHRIEANIQPSNVGSIALVRRLGFRLEGFSLDIFGSGEIGGITSGMQCERKTGLLRVLLMPNNWVKCLGEMMAGRTIKSRLPPARAVPDRELERRGDRTLARPPLVVRALLRLHRQPCRFVGFSCVPES